MSSSRKTTQTMRKLIFIMDVLEIVKGLKKGKRIEGVLYLDKNTGVPTFKAYNRTSKSRPQDKVLRYLEHGWVKESSERIKVYESMPKRLGAARMIMTLERETKEAANVIVEQEIFG